MLSPTRASTSLVRTSNSPAASSFNSSPHSSPAKDRGDVYFEDETQLVKAVKVDRNFSSKSPLTFYFISPKTRLPQSKIDDYTQPEGHLEVINKTKEAALTLSKTCNAGLVLTFIAKLEGDPRMHSLDIEYQEGEIKKDETVRVVQKRKARVVTEETVEHNLLYPQKLTIKEIAHDQLNPLLNMIVSKELMSIDQRNLIKV